MKRYSFKFHIKIEQISVQGDHLHLLIRASRRSTYQSFFRVFAGQIAQQFEKEGLLSVNLVTDTPSGRQKWLGETKMSDGQDDASDCRALRGGRKSRSQVRGEGLVGASGKRKDQKKQKLWKYRPFSRVIRGWKAYQTVRDYIQLNEKEALNQIAYKPQRLRGLSAGEWQLLWS